MLRCYETCEQVARLLLVYLKEARTRASLGHVTIPTAHFAHYGLARSVDCELGGRAQMVPPAGLGRPPLAHAELLVIPGGQAFTKERQAGMGESSPLGTEWRKQVPVSVRRVLVRASSDVAGAAALDLRLDLRKVSSSASSRSTEVRCSDPFPCWPFSHLSRLLDCHTCWSIRV